MKAVKLLRNMAMHEDSVAGVRTLLNLFIDSRRVVGHCRGKGKEKEIRIYECVYIHTVFNTSKHSYVLSPLYLPKLFYHYSQSYYTVSEFVLDGIQCLLVQSKQFTNIKKILF